MKPLIITLICVFSILASLLLLSFAVAGYMVHFLSFPKLVDRKECYRVDEEKSVIKEGAQYQRVDFEMVARDGYVIHGDYVINDPKKFVIMCHGYTWSREGDLKESLGFYRSGYSLVMPDMRGHGDNKRVAVTMGYLEKRDIEDLIAWTKKKFGADIEIGLFGESMGAATVCLCSQNPDIRFVVSDCAYAELRGLLHHQVKLNHLPVMLLPLSSLLLKISHGYFIRDIQPKEVVKGATVPMLFIHGKNDDFIPPHHCNELYDACGSKTKKMVFYSGCKHAESSIYQQKEYTEEVITFLRAIQ